MISGWTLPLGSVITPRTFAKIIGQKNTFQVPQMAPEPDVIHAGFRPLPFLTKEKNPRNVSTVRTKGFVFWLLLILFNKICLFHLWEQILTLLKPVSLFDDVTMMHKEKLSGSELCSHLQVDHYKVMCKFGNVLGLSEFGLQCWWKKRGNNSLWKFIIISTSTALTPQTSTVRKSNSFTVDFVTHLYRLRTTFCGWWPW